MPGILGSLSSDRENKTPFHNLQAHLASLWFRKVTVASLAGRRGRDSVLATSSTVSLLRENYCYLLYVLGSS